MKLTLDENIKLSAIQYPDLYMDPYMDGTLWPDTRRNILGHMYLTLGSGYHWNKDGYLQEEGYSRLAVEIIKAIRSGSDEKILEVRKKVAKKYCNISIHFRGCRETKVREDGLYDFNKAREEYLTLLQDNARWEGNRDTLVYRFNPYPISHGPHDPAALGTLTDIPNNVRFDYFAGACEILKDVVDLPFAMSDGYSVENQKKLAQEWISYLCMRFTPWGG